MKNILVVDGLHEDEILHSYMGITINHYKDPYSTTSTMESKKFFFFVAHVFSFICPISKREQQKDERGRRWWIFGDFGHFVGSAYWKS